MPAKRRGKVVAVVVVVVAGALRVTLGVFCRDDLLAWWYGYRLHAPPFGVQVSVGGSFSLRPGGVTVLVGLLRF